MQVGAAIVVAIVALAPAASTSFAAESSLSVGSRSGTQIIMRDGGVCDPIRHMGC
jgi:hypothetical protein